MRKIQIKENTEQNEREIDKNNNTRKKVCKKQTRKGRKWGVEIEEDGIEKRERKYLKNERDIRKKSGSWNYRKERTYKHAFASHKHFKLRNIHIFFIYNS